MPASLQHLSDPNQLSENVLARWPEDGRYYKVVILDCDAKERRCLVRYEDNTEGCVEAKDLHIQLSLEQLKDENIVCCVCDGGFSKAPNEIIMCDFCQQGYHINCHEPIIDREGNNLDDDEVEWLCSTCNDLNKQQYQEKPQRALEKPQRTSDPVTPKKRVSQIKQKSKSTQKIKKIKLAKPTISQEKVPTLTETNNFVNTLCPSEEVVRTEGQEKEEERDRDKEEKKEASAGQDEDIKKKKGAGKRKAKDMDKKEKNVDKKKEKSGDKKIEKSLGKKKDSDNMSEQKTASAF